MLLLGIAGLAVGYALLYYAADAMTNYDSTGKITRGLPLTEVFGFHNKTLKTGTTGGVYAKAWARFGLDSGSGTKPAANTSPATPPPPNGPAPAPAGGGPLRSV